MISLKLWSIRKICNNLSQVKVNFLGLASHFLRKSSNLISINVFRSKYMNVRSVSRWVVWRLLCGASTFVSDEKTHSQRADVYPAVTARRYNIERTGAVSIWFLHLYIVTLSKSTVSFLFSWKNDPFSYSFIKILWKTWHSATKSLLLSSSFENLFLTTGIVSAHSYNGVKLSESRKLSFHDGTRCSIADHTKVLSEENRRPKSSSIWSIHFVTTDRRFPLSRLGTKCVTILSRKLAGKLVLRDDRVLSPARNEIKCIIL